MMLPLVATDHRGTMATCLTLPNKTGVPHIIGGKLCIIGGCLCYTLERTNPLMESLVHGYFIIITYSQQGVLIYKPIVISYLWKYTYTTIL